MKKTILEARSFVSSHPVAYNRVVKDYEIDLECSDGRSYTCNGKTYTLKTGDILVRKPGDIVSSVGKQRSYILTLDFSSDKQPTVYSRNLSGTKQPLTNNELITALPSLMHPRNPHALFKIYEKLVRVPVLSSIKAHALVDEIIYILSADVAHKIYTSQKDGNEIIGKVIDYMEEHISEKITLSKLAAISNFEKSYFVRFFKKECGTTPLKMLNKMRLEHASDLVISTDMKICDIAMSYGYNTTSFFISEYKKRFGLTPASHRSSFGKHQNDN